MMKYSFALPGKIQITDPENFWRDITEMASGKTCLFLTSSRMIARLGLVERFEALRLRSRVQVLEYSVANPTEHDISRILCRIGEKPEMIAAIGGGSILDSAKMVKAFSYLIGKAPDGAAVNAAVTDRAYLQHPSDIELIAVPTTAGTGSEVTRWATLWSGRDAKKYSVEAEWLAPDYAFLLPAYTRDLPARQTLSTGLDALMHAVESYWAVSSNELVREIAKASIGLTVEYLPALLRDLGDLKLRKKMCLASLLAGMAFGNTKTTVCHSISYPMTMDHGVEHGFAAASTLTAALRFNRDYISEFDLLLKAFGAQSIEDIDSWMRSLTKDIQPCCLEAFGISEEEIPALANRAFTAGRIDNNPRSCSYQDVCAILTSSYSQRI